MFCLLFWLLICCFVYLMWCKLLLVIVAVWYVLPFCWFGVLLTFALLCLLWLVWCVGLYCLLFDLYLIWNRLVVCLDALYWLLVVVCFIGSAWLLFGCDCLIVLLLIVLCVFSFSNLWFVWYYVCELLGVLLLCLVWVFSVFVCLFRLVVRLLVLWLV